MLCSVEGSAAGIRIRGATRDLVIRGNTIRDTREGGERTQTTGILVEETVGPLEAEDNRIEAAVPIDDRRE